MLPVTHGEAETRRQILLYSLVLVPVTLALWPLGAAGPSTGFPAALLGAMFVALARARCSERQRSRTPCSCSGTRFSICSCCSCSLTADAVVRYVCRRSRRIADVARIPLHSGAGAW